MGDTDNVDGGDGDDGINSLSLSVADVLFESFGGPHASLFLEPALGVPAISCATLRIKSLANVVISHEPRCNTGFIGFT